MGKREPRITRITRITKDEATRRDRNTGRAFFGRIMLAFPIISADSCAIRGLFRLQFEELRTPRQAVRERVHNKLQWVGFAILWSYRGSSWWLRVHLEGHRTGRRRNLITPAGKRRGSCFTGGAFRRRKNLKTPAGKRRGSHPARRRQFVGAETWEPDPRTVTGARYQQRRWKRTVSRLDESLRTGG